MIDLASPLPETVAAVDLGSNSFHLKVARFSAGELVVVDRLREMVQLAAGLDEGRRLSPEAQVRALDCLRRFGQRLRHMPSEAVRAVGTNTLRRARQAREFLQRAEEALGHSIETISGREEARLIYLGVTHSLPAFEGRRLVLDIGGGSTEVIVGQGLNPLRMESLYVGCVALSRKHFAEGLIDRKSWRRAELEALQEFEPIQAAYVESAWEQAIGASGTIRAVDAVVRAAGWSKSGITAKALRRLRDALLAAGDVRTLNLAGVSPGRLPVFPGGVVLLAAAFEALQIEQLLPADGALREGLLYDLVGRIGEGDVRNRSVTALADRYHVDWNQAGRVECTALRLFEMAAAAWGLDRRVALPYLRWAAQLHEIGLDIAHQHYHHHGEYIVAQSDLYGFTREEQQVLGLLLRAHRRKFPLAAIRALPLRRTKTIERLAVLLRLAVVLHRSRSPRPLPGLQLTVERRVLNLAFPAGWLDEHPLTREDLEQERARLGPADYRLALQDGVGSRSI